MKNITAELKGFLGGEYQIQVVKKNGEVTYPLGKKFIKNLILNSGIDQVFTNSSDGDSGMWGALLAYCRAGSGTTPVDAAQTTLVAQLKSSNSYFSGSGANGTVNDTVTGSATHKRTYEFTAETGAVSYNEIGIGVLSTGDLFSRVVLPSTLNLIAGDNLRVVYQLTISIPQVITPSAVSLTTTGWDATGQLKVVGTFANIFGTMDSLGAFSGGLVSRALSGRGGTSFGTNNNFNLLSTAAFPAVNAALWPLTVVSAQAAQVYSIATYTAGSFIRDMTYTVPPASPVSSITNVRSVYWTGSPNAFVSSAQSAGLMLLLNADQPKSNEYRLSFTYRFTWARI